MALKLRNNWKYKGDDWWEWDAFLDDSGTGELSQVKYVEYFLHPTFDNPVRKITDRKNKFKLETGGWGTFKLKAFVYFNDGNRQKLMHEIQLEYEPVKGTSK